MKKNFSKKRLKRISIWTIMLGIALPSAAVMVKKTYDHYTGYAKNFFTPKNVSCTIFNVFCKKTHDQITQFVQARTSQESLLHFDRVTFYNDLKEHFPIVKSLDWRFNIAQTLELHIIGTTPYCIVNNHHVLGDKKRLFSKSFFQDAHLETLPNITIHQPIESDDVSTQVYNFVHKISPETWQQFTISYHSQSTIELIPRQSICKCRIITDQTTFFQKNKFNALSAIFSDLCQQGLITKRMLKSQTIPLAFDFRIKDQIIIKFHDPRGRGKG